MMLPKNNILASLFSFLKGLGQSLLATLILLVLLEGLFRVLGFPPGESSYVQKVIFQEKLSVHKPKDEIRIFTYGESSMHGSHYAPKSCIPIWLDHYLKEFLPEKKIKIVNFSRMGQGSYYVYETFRDTIAYQPDYAVFYMGHNIFLPGNRVDQVKKKIAKNRKKDWLRSSRFFSAVYRKVIEMRIKQEPYRFPDDSIEFKDIEVFPGGISIEENQALNGSPYYWDNIRFFEENLNKILTLGSKNDIRQVFYLPVGNLKDFPPRGSYHSRLLSKQETEGWEKHYTEGQTHEAAKEFSAALAAYEKAEAIDPRYADLAYRMGKLYLQMGELEKARAHFITARDYDPVIVRATTDVQELFKKYHAEKKIELIDTEKAVIAEVPGGILGFPLIEDNVHFSIRGHALKAHALALFLAEKGWIAPRAEWRLEHEKTYNEIYQQLGIDQDIIFAAYIKLANFFGSRYEERMSFIRRALELKPDDMRAKRYLAWTQWLMGNKDDAARFYRDLAAQDPDLLRKIFSIQPALEKEYHSLLPENLPAKS